jgi:hypothetical protein
MSLQPLAHTLAKVGQQVPAIGDLPRLRCPTSRPVRIGTGSISADDFDSRMLLKPGCQCFCLAIR